jgi:hypothetical protein
MMMVMVMMMMAVVVIMMMMMMKQLLTCCGGDDAQIKETVTLGVAGGSGSGFVGVNGTLYFETNVARSAWASFRALAMGSVTNSLREDGVRKLQRDGGCCW